MNDSGRDRPLKVLTVFGTRPEAIKMAPVIRELKRRSTEGRARSVVCVTGQHREMLDQVLRLFEIHADYDLAIMKPNQSPTQAASTILARLEPVIEAERPDWVLVQGDTTTAAVGALAAFYAKVRVGHIEAGLRTDDKWQPFPEEINRRVAGVIADLHFAPTEQSLRNLLHEGIPNERIRVTGNPVIDALHWAAQQPLPLTPNPWLAGTNDSARLILVTAHRRESFGPPLESICYGLRDIAERYGSHVRIVYPVHLNPNVREPVYRILGDVPNVTLIPPLDYLPMVHLIKQAHLVMTDSGGIQEEAPGLGKPVLVFRDVTERPEAVTAGTVRLVGANRERIVAEASRLLDDSDQYAQMTCGVNPYGDGLAAGRIVGILMGDHVVDWCYQESKQDRNLV